MLSQHENSLRVWWGNQVDIARIHFSSLEFEEENYIVLLQYAIMSKTK